MNRIKDFLSSRWSKYIVTFIAFIIWMLFFDTNSYLSHRALDKELDKVTKEKEFYISEIEVDSKRANDLMSSEENLERFAREEYLMKRENEDVYLIIKK